MQKLYCTCFRDFRSFWTE